MVVPPNIDFEIGELKNIYALLLKHVAQSYGEFFQFALKMTSFNS